MCSRWQIQPKGGRALPGRIRRAGDGLTGGRAERIWGDCDLRISGGCRPGPRLAAGAARGDRQHRTDAGRLYYEQSSQALRTIEDANLRLAEARAEPSSTIRISAPVGFGAYFLTGTVFDFLAIYPKTKVELRLTDDKLNLVENGIDLAFRTEFCQTPR